MPLRETLSRIITEYPKATKEPFARHPLAAFIRLEAATTAEAALGSLGAGLLVEGSAGAGNWAAVPWIAVFDPAVTTSATEGYYVVYLFHVSDPVVHLSINQGTTAVREEFGGRAREILQDRADLMRKRVVEYSDALAVSKIDLGSVHLKMERAAPQEARLNQEDGMKGAPLRIDRHENQRSLDDAGSGPSGAQRFYEYTP